MHRNHKSGEARHGKRIFRQILCLLALAVQPAFADRLVAELAFERRPPIAGLIYLPSPRGVAPQVKVEIDQKNKEFTRNLAVASPQSKLVFLNSDDYDHNIYASDGQIGVHFDFGLMPKGTEFSRKVDWPTDNLLRIGCKIHPRMRMYVANVTALAQHVFEFERDSLSYRAELDIPPGYGGPVRLMLAGYDDVEAVLPNGPVVEIALQRKGRPDGTLKLSRKPK